MRINGISATNIQLIQAKRTANPIFNGKSNVLSQTVQVSTNKKKKLLGLGMGISLAILGACGGNKQKDLGMKIEDVVKNLIVDKETALQYVSAFDIDNNGYLNNKEQAVYNNSVLDVDNNGTKTITTTFIDGTAETVELTEGYKHSPQKSVEISDY